MNRLNISCRPNWVLQRTRYRLWIPLLRCHICLSLLALKPLRSLATFGVREPSVWSANSRLKTPAKYWQWCWEISGIMGYVDRIVSTYSVSDSDKHCQLWPLVNDWVTRTCTHSTTQHYILRPLRTSEERLFCDVLVDNDTLLTAYVRYSFPANNNEIVVWPATAAIVTYVYRYSFDVTHSQVHANILCGIVRVKNVTKIHTKKLQWGNVYVYVTALPCKIWSQSWSCSVVH